MADEQKVKKNSKLHELLAVVDSLKSQAEKTRTDLLATFEKKRHLFSEKIVTFKPSLEGEGLEKREEQSDLQSTVKGELTWITGIWEKALDASYQVANSNMDARADIMLDDDVLVANVPATALLELEKRTQEIREFVAQIPTLDPAKGFQPDTARGKGIYKARETLVTRTKKMQKALVLYEATKEHPAQVKEISVDEPIGTLLTQEWSGLITPSEKADMLARAEKLVRAVKQARTRANAVDVDQKQKLGNKLLSYVFGN